jgi:hypothetical protein
MVLAIGMIGVRYQEQSRAASTYVSAEPEKGTLGGTAKVISDAAASAGSAVQFSAATPPPPPPPPSNTLGMYNGNPNEAPDEHFIRLMGTPGQISSTYVTTQTINEVYEKARVAAGTNVFLDLDPKSTPGLMYEISIQSTNGMTYVNNFLAAAQRVATSSTKAKVYVSLSHEWEVKRAQGKWTDARDADINNYAKANSIFNARAAAIAPAVLPGFWTGGYKTNQPVLAQVMAAMTTPSKWVSVDPYRTSGTQTLLQNWNSFGVDFFQADPTYIKWGKPPIFITEFGISTHNVSDTDLAIYLTDIRGTMRSAGVSGAIYFNRTKPEEAPNTWTLDGGTTPKALAAFKSSFLAN